VVLARQYLASYIEIRALVAAGLSSKRRFGVILTNIETCRLLFNYSPKCEIHENVVSGLRIVWLRTEIHFKILYDLARCDAVPFGIWVSRCFEPHRHFNHKSKESVECLPLACQAEGAAGTNLFVLRLLGTDFHDGNRCLKEIFPCLTFHVHFCVTVSVLPGRARTGAQRHTAGSVGTLLHVRIPGALRHSLDKPTSSHPCDASQAIVGGRGSERHHV
jgi:hypothetical protein